MHIRREHLRVVREILAALVPDLDVWAFGSRATGERLKPFSDLDLAIVADRPMEARRMGLLADAFAESDLPFRVDIVELAAVDASFRRRIDERHEVVQRGGARPSHAPP